MASPTGRRYNFSFSFAFPDRMEVTSQGHFYQESVDELKAAEHVHEIIARDRERNPGLSSGVLSGLRISLGKERRNADAG